MVKDGTWWLSRREGQRPLAEAGGSQRSKESPVEGELCYSLAREDHKR